MDEISMWTADRIAEVKTTRRVDEVYLCRHRGADALGYYKDGVFCLVEGSKLSPSFQRQTEEFWERPDYCVELRFRTEMTDDGYFKDNRATRDEPFGSSLEMARIVCGERLEEGDWWQKL